jgi:hypothetical protein
MEEIGNPNLFVFVFVFVLFCLKKFLFSCLHKGWTGDWSGGSQLWTPELKEAVGAVPAEGVFWMSYSDVLKYFSAVEICKVRDNWDDSRIPLFFGGSPVAFRPSSSMFLVSVTKPTWLVLQLIQEDERGKVEEEDGDYQYSDLSLFVTETSANPLNFIDQADDGIPHCEYFHHHIILIELCGLIDPFLVFFFFSFLLKKNK